VKGSEAPTQQSQPDPKISQVVPDPLSHKSQQLTTPQALPQALAGTSASASQAAPVGAQAVGPSPGADWIPGSRLATREAVGGFRARLACTSAEGRWVVDPTPRLLPWASDEGNFGHCDGRWTWNAGKVSHGAADEIFSRACPLPGGRCGPASSSCGAPTSTSAGRRRRCRSLTGGESAGFFCRGRGEGSRAASTAGGEG